MSPLHSRVMHLFLSLVLAVVVGSIAAFMATPLLWRIEKFLGIELAGHSGPADIVILLFVLFTWILFCICGWLVIKRKRDRMRSQAMKNGFKTRH